MRFSLRCKLGMHDYQMPDQAYLDLCRDAATKLIEAGGLSGSEESKVHQAAFFKATTPVCLRCGKEYKF